MTRGPGTTLRWGEHDLRERGLPTTSCPLRTLVIVHFPAALSLAQSGAFGLDGLFANLAPLVFMVWVVATCVPLARREGARLVPPGPAQEDAIHPTA